MRYYIATSLGNAEQAQTLMEYLNAHGHAPTVDWTRLPALHPNDPRYRVGADTGSFTDRAVLDLNGVRDADVVVAILPGGLGTHVELGAALALGKRVVLWAPGGVFRHHGPGGYPCVFWYHPEIAYCCEGGLNEAVAAVRAQVAL